MKLLLLMTALFCSGVAEEIPKQFNGTWKFDAPLTEEIGFGKEAWSMIGNQPLIEEAKMLSFEIKEGKISAMRNGVAVKEQDESIILSTSEKQFVMKKVKSGAINLTTLLSENVILLESGAVPRFVFRRNGQIPK